jgi:hypothetical protein
VGFVAAAMVGMVHDELRGGAMRSYAVTNRGRRSRGLSDSRRSVAQLLSHLHIISSAPITVPIPREYLKDDDEIPDAMVSLLLSSPVVHVPNAVAAMSLHL